MRRCVYISFLYLLFLSIYSGSVTAQDQNKIIARALVGGELVVDHYTFYRQTKINVSDLILIDNIETKRDIFNTVYGGASIDYRILLLEKGYARLRDETTARQAEASAQSKARNNKIGMWRASKTTQPPGSTDRPTPTTIDFNRVIKILWNTLPVLASLGIFGAIGWLAKKIYKKFYIQRKCKLLIIGEPSTGKTALLYNLIDPGVSRDTILGLDQSRATKMMRAKKIIPRGKFEFLPELSDIPGSAFSSVWDSLLGASSHALVMVVAPTRLNQNKNGTISDSDIAGRVDQKYVDMQIGYVQAYIEGGIGAKATKKPKSVILFISKFDLYSRMPPDDSYSSSAKKQILTIFSEHINSARAATKKAGVAFEVVIGSSVEKWNTEKVLDIATEQLYK